MIVTRTDDNDEDDVEDDDDADNDEAPDPDCDDRGDDSVDLDGGDNVDTARTPVAPADENNGGDKRNEDSDKAKDDCVGGYDA
jgi:hypothetical protein